MKRAAVACAVVVCALLGSSAASATGLFRAYVSSKGNDANDCTLPHPCRLLPKAIAAVASGGEVWMLDSANYNTGPVNIDRSVTILAIPGALGSVVATGGGDAIFIGAAGIKVTLRNLLIVPLGSGNDGIGIDPASELDVEDCEISNMGGSGIAAFDAAATVRVTSTRLRGNNNGVYARGAVVVSLDRVTSVGNANAGIYADAGSTVIASNSVLRNNGNNGAYAIASTLTLQGTQSDANVTAGLFADSGSEVAASDNRFANNGSYGVIGNAVSGEITDVTLVDNIASQRGASVGFRVATSGTGQTFMTADGNKCLCFRAFQFVGGTGFEAIRTAGNNSILNSLNVEGGTLTPLPVPFL